LVFELVLGVVLAALFVMAYLAFSRLWNDDPNAIAGTAPGASLRPADSHNAIGAGTAPRELNPSITSDEPTRD
jgi:hypothetical protein